MSKSNNTSGLSFAAALGLLFIGLKLGGAIDWSWWIVLLPLYGPAALVLGFVLLCALAIGLITVAEEVWKRR